MEMGLRMSLHRYGLVNASQIDIGPCMGEWVKECVKEVDE